MSGESARHPASIHADDQHDLSSERITNRIIFVRGLSRSDQILLNTSVPFVPPNPKLLFIATLIFMSRATFAQ